VFVEMVIKDYPVFYIVLLRTKNIKVESILKKDDIINLGKAIINKRGIHD
jgi:hypothetical protein